MTVTSNVLYRTVGSANLYLDVVKPAAGGPYPAVLIMHGGWTGSTRDTATNYAKTMAPKGFAMFSVDYRMTCKPDNPPAGVDPALCGYSFPAQEQDLEGAIDWIKANGAAYGASTTRIGALGTSRGGTLVETLGALAPAAEKPQVVVGWSGQPELWLFTEANEPETLESTLGNYVGCPYDDPPNPCPDTWVSDVLAPGQTVTVTLFTSGDDSTPGVEYQSLLPTTFTWTSADPATKSVGVAVNGDSAVENNETFHLRIQGTSGNVLIGDVSGLATIVDDD